MYLQLEKDKDKKQSPFFCPSTIQGRTNTKHISYLGRGRLQTLVARDDADTDRVVGHAMAMGAARIHGLIERQSSGEVGYGDTCVCLCVCGGGGGVRKEPSD